MDQISKNFRRLLRRLFGPKTRASYFFNNNLEIKKARILFENLSCSKKLILFENFYEHLFRNLHRNHFSKGGITSLARLKYHVSRSFCAALPQLLSQKETFPNWNKFNNFFCTLIMDIDFFVEKILKKCLNNIWRVFGRGW